MGNPAKSDKKKNKDKPQRHGIVEDFYTHGDEEEEDESTKKRSPISILGNLIFLLTITIILGIGWIVYQTWSPQDLSSLPGYRKAEHAPNIPELLRKADKTNSILTLNEDDVNRYLASTLKASQNGVLAPFSRPVGIGIKFHDQFMEIIIERNVLSSMTQTVSIFITIHQEEGSAGHLPITRIEFCGKDDKSHFITHGGTLGSVTVPQGYMMFLRPAFENLATAYKDLLSSLIDSGRLIQFTKGQVDLMPARRDADI
ncbi:MAG: hypothetical protein RSB48_06565 [Akkermansia sp.]